MVPFKKVFLLFLLTLTVLLSQPASLAAQTATTGTLQGTVADPSRAYVAGAAVRLKHVGTNVERRTQTDAAGRYSFPLLEPGLYEMEVSRSGFSTLHQSGIEIRVTETTVLDMVLRVAQVSETVVVQAEAEMVQTASATLGRVVEQRQVVNLPLATRNYTQILALSPGVMTDVANAGTLGRNSLEISAQGARRSDNNVQVNGSDANNVFATQLSDAVGGQGVAVPAPDTIQEFKVQTALYDASSGRNGGANVNVVTKSGTNDLRGNFYHFLRNEALNANEFFRNRAGLPKPRLRQNQFGGTLGGPIRKDSTFFFVSYEGNRQSNGVTSGATSTVFLPPLTNDRSAAALGRLFGGQRGFQGLLGPAGAGVAVAADGSNIHPIALKLLNTRLPDGQFLIPSPQIALPTGIGLATFSVPAKYSENQFNTNLDQRFGSNDTVSAKYFYSQATTLVPFGSGATVPGFPANNEGSNHNGTLSWTRILRSTLMNEARAAFTRLNALVAPEEPVLARDLGIKTPPTAAGIPNIAFVTSNLSFGVLPQAPPRGSAINNFQFADSVAYVRGGHRIRAGGEYKHIQANARFDFDHHTTLVYAGFPDFLLSQPFPANGAPVPFSHVFASLSSVGLFGRAQRMNDWAGYFQDDISLHPQWQLNLGVRYEVYGQVSDALGRMSDFDLAGALTDPPASGTFTGFVLASNSLGKGKDPGGVVRLDRENILANDLNNWGPRFGFSYRPLARRTFVIRGGYGAYFSRPATVTPFQTGPNLPFAVIAVRQDTGNRTATLQDPFDPTLPLPQDLPVYQPRTPTSSMFVNAIDPAIRAPTVHQWSLNAQYGFLRDYLFELGYVGTRGTGLVGQYRFNQAYLATPSNPIRGQTTSTRANLGFRLPYQGINPQTSLLYTNGFDSIYHALQASLTKRFSHGLQFQASYTWSRNIDNVPDGSVTGLASLAVGTFIGDVRNFRLGRSSADIDRRHRFVWNGYWELPRWQRAGGGWAKLLHGWALAGIVTMQAGLPLTVIDSGAAAIFGLGGQPNRVASRAQLAPGATGESIQLSGSVTSRLNGYFNKAGFAQAPAIGDATGYGNSPRNFLRGPDQRNVDVAILKRTATGWPSERANLEFRVEFFNAFNTVNFGQPANNFASPPTLGVISTTTVAPRIIQLALKYNF